MPTELPPATRRLGARVLDLSPWPIAVVEGLLLVWLLDRLLLLPLAVWLLHDPRLPARLRAREWHGLAWPSSARMMVSMAATSVGTGTWPAALGALVGVHGALLIGLLALVRRGHFQPRIALVGPAIATGAVARNLAVRNPGLCVVVGEFEETPVDLARLLDLARREGLDTVLLATGAGTSPPGPDTLPTLRQLSVPLLQAAPDGLPADDGGLTVDGLSTAGFLEIARRHGQERFGFAVTPNAHHLVRLERDAEFRDSYAMADFVLLDSRFIAHWLRWTRGERWAVCPGSDLTAALFAQVMTPTDRLVIIGATTAQVEQLRLRHGLRDVHHHQPPMGFIADAAATAACLRFIEQHSPFRFCLLAVGSPQQERLAAALKRRGKARGLALCVGASLDFLTAAQRRAPRWMQRLGLEWLHRWWQDPVRLTRRYLLDCPRVFGVLRRRPLRLRGDGFSEPRAIAAAPADSAGNAPPSSRRRTG